MVFVDNFERMNADDNAEQPPAPYSRRKSDVGRTSSGSSRQVPIGQLISKEAVVNVMLRKGLCSEAELLEEERRLRGSNGSFDDSQYVRIPDPESAQSWDRPQHPLRKVFSKFRWSRRLGTAIFGWKWRRVKKEQAEERTY